MKLIFILILLTFSSMSFEQEDNIKFDEVKVIKEFNATLGDFNKINIDPVLPVFNLKNRTYNYSVRSVAVRLEYEQPKIRPLALKTIPPVQSNRNAIKLGYGIPKYLKAGVSIGYKKQNMNSNFAFNHISTDNSKSLSDQKSSKTDLDFSFFNRQNDKELEYGLNTWLDVDYFYLYATEAKKDSSIDNKRRFLRGDIKAFIKKENIIENLTNETGLRYKLLQLNTSGEIENNLIIDDNLQYSLNKNMLMAIQVKADFLQSDKKYYLISSTPQFIFHSKKFNAKIGGYFAKTQEKLYTFPSGELSVNVFHNFLEIFAGVSNDVFYNSNYIKTGINPFLNFDRDTTLSSTYNNYSGGVRSSLEGAKIEFIATWQKFINKLFFINSSIDKRTFDAIYDNGTNFKMEVNASYKFIPQLEISGNLTKNLYKTDNLRKAWFTPDFTANFTTKSFLFDEKLQIIGDLYFASQSWYKGEDGNSYKLDPLFDISAETKYKIFNNSFLFAEVNNIFSQKYQRWYQYPSVGINILGGIEISF